MISIQEASVAISDKLAGRRLELAGELEQVNKLIAVTAKEFKDAAEKGDHSENAAYSEAKDKLTKLNTQKLYLLQSIRDINAITPDLRYVPKSYIGMYSTFRLKRLDTGEVSTWRVYPGSLSNVEIGVMSSECPIYKLLDGKEEGDIVESTHRISGKVIKFEVLEVY